MLSRSFWACALFSFAVACGGAETGGNNAFLVETLRSFDDNTGVTRLTYGDAQTPVVFQTMATNARTSAFDPAQTPGTLANFQTRVTSPSGILTSGQASVGGASIPVITYVSNTGDLRGGFLAYPGDGVLFAGGPAPSALPSGRLFYSGINVGGQRTGDNIEDGTFRITADFDTNLISLTGRTDNSQIAAQDISLDRANGTFASNTLTATVDGRQLTGSISGSFHSAGATGVTALYNDNASVPVFAGALVGTR